MHSGANLKNAVSGVVVVSGIIAVGLFFSFFSSRTIPSTGGAYVAAVIHSASTTQNTVVPKKILRKSKAKKVLKPLLPSALVLPVATSSLNKGTATSSSAQSTSTTTSLQATSTTTASSTATSVVQPTKDTTPPIRANGSPSNVLPLSILPTKITVSLTTNEPARCYWANTPNVPFDLMTPSFAVTGDTVHILQIALTTTGDYAYFVKCRDSAMNANTSDYPILFSVEHKISGKDPYLPRVFMSAPTNNDVFTEGLVTLSAAASDNGGVQGVRFFLNSQDLGVEDTTSPFALTVMLPPGRYSVYAIARDGDGNSATSPTVSFSVIPKVASSTAAIRSNFAAVEHATPSTLKRWLNFLLALLWPCHQAACE